MMDIKSAIQQLSAMPDTEKLDCAKQIIEE